MSSLIFFTDEAQALVATDTLAMSYDKRTPFMFTTKAFAVPHLRMIICGYGAGAFCGQWFIEVNDWMIVPGIDSLNYHAPDSLMLLWGQFKERFPVFNEYSTTIYHFGISEEDNLIHAYAYRSSSNFNSERLPYTVGVRPECAIPDPQDFPDDIKKMMREQRQIQAKKTKEERTYIGGEIQIHHLTKSGISVYTLDRFEDYEADKTAIYENYKKQ